MMKRRWSGFYETTLDETLETIGAHYLIITCCTTSNCIESTIRDAAMRDYACLLSADCTAQPAARGIVAILKITDRNCARHRRHRYSELPTSAPDAYGEC